MSYFGQSNRLLPFLNFIKYARQKIALSGRFYTHVHVYVYVHTYTTPPTTTTFKVFVCRLLSTVLHMGAAIVIRTTVVSRHTDHVEPETHDRKPKRISLPLPKWRKGKLGSFEMVSENPVLLLPVGNQILSRNIVC